MVDEAKLRELPKWAQDELRKLRRSLEETQKKLAEISGDEKSNTYIHAFSTKEKPLSNNALIQFRLDGGQKITCSVFHGLLSVHGSKAITILPRDCGSFALK